jgi:hypothetical protein
MPKPETLVVDGHGFCWQRLCELRRQQQLEAWRTEQARQLVLFEMRDDHRPMTERTPARRYEEPTLFERTRGAE